MTKPKHLQKPLHGPELRVCANWTCRRPYNPALRTGFSQSRGLCPRCCAAVVSKNGWVLDKEIYDQCQKVNEIEPRFRSTGRTTKSGGLRSEAQQYDDERLAELAKKPLKKPYIPSARGSGRKRGGPATAGNATDGGA